MRIAAVDIGTNTLLLLVVERRGDELVAIEERCEIARLGEGVDRTRRLAPQAIARATKTLAAYAERIRAHGVTQVAVVGTQALREVENGSEFRQNVARLLGTEVEVITGEREAELCWRAVAESFPLCTQGQRTVVDIGGGSTELIVGGQRIERVASVAIGSVRLTERLLHHDPPTGEERDALIATVDRALDSAPQPTGEIIGVAGTVTTLAAMALGLTDYDGAKVHGHRLRREEVEAQVERLGRTPLAARRRTPGLDPRRADVIYAGAMILSRLLARTRANEVVVSDRGIRWGLVYEVAAEVAARLSR